MSQALTPSTPLVLADLLPRRRVVDVALVVGVAALTGLCAQASFPVPGSPVPITLQTFAVLAGGAALGARRALAAFALYAVVGVLGVPWFSGQGSGWQFVSFGYILGFVLAGVAVGALAERGFARTPARTAVLMAVGTAIVYAAAIPWWMVYGDATLSTIWDLGIKNYLAGDALKALAAAGILPAATRLLPRA